jgi:hypothetical protein
MKTSYTVPYMRYVRAEKTEFWGGEEKQIMYISFWQQNEHFAPIFVRPFFFRHPLNPKPQTLNPKP